MKGKTYKQSTKFMRSKRMMSMREAGYLSQTSDRNKRRLAAKPKRQDRKLP